MARIKMANKTLIAQLKKYIARPELKRSALTTSKINLEKDLEAIEKVDLGIEKVIQRDLYAQRLSKSYPVIDPSFLSMKHPQIKHTYISYPNYIYLRSESEISLPRFGVYSLESPYCRIHVNFVGSNDERFDESKFHIKIDEGLIKELENPLKESVSLLRYAMAQNRYNVTLTSTFSGIIPQETKRNIGIAKKVFGDNINIIAEAKSWEAEETSWRYKAPPLKGDPLVVGEYNGVCYLIDSFDTTLMEEYVRREFSQGGLK